MNTYIMTQIKVLSLVKCGRQIMCYRAVSSCPGCSCFEFRRLSQTKWSLECKSLRLESEIISIHSQFQCIDKPGTDPMAACLTFLKYKTARTGCCFPIRIVLKMSSEVI